jgi:hypothetical protein
MRAAGSAGTPCCHGRADRRAGVSRRPQARCEPRGHGGHGGGAHTAAGRAAGPAPVTVSGAPGPLTPLTLRAVVPAAAGVCSSDAANHRTVTRRRGAANVPRTGELAALTWDCPPGICAGIGLSWQFVYPPVAVAGPWLVSGERLLSQGLHHFSALPAPACRCLGYNTEPDRGEAMLIALLIALSVDLVAVGGSMR